MPVTAFTLNVELSLMPLKILPPTLTVPPSRVTEPRAAMLPSIWITPVPRVRAAGSNVPVVSTASG